MNRKRYRRSYQGVIYKATNTLTNQVYIGKTAYTLRRRSLGHRRDAKRGSQTKFHKALMEFGLDVFHWEIIDVFLTHQQSRQKERFWINKLNSIKEGYNSL